MAKKSKSGAHPAPSLSEARSIKVHVARSVPDSATAIGIAVGVRGTVPRQLGVDRDALAAAGFEGKLGQTFVVPRDKRSVLVAVGVGDAGLDEAGLRNAAAAFTRASARHAHLATGLADAAGSGVAPAAAAAAVTEGMLLARYRYEQRKRVKSDQPLAELTLVTTAERAKAATAGAARGKAMASAAMLARDLANAPAMELTAARMADIAQDVARDRGLQVEVFGKADLEKMGCGGILGVNAGSTEPPRMVKLTYKPKGRSKGHLAMVGQGHHVRLGRHQHQAARGHAALHEDGHGGCRRRARRDVRSARARLPDDGHRFPHVHRQHALRARRKDGRRAHAPQRQDGRDPQHRRRGPPASSPTASRWPPR